MGRTWVHTSCLIAVLSLGCGDDDGGGNTSALVDRQLELDREQDMLECACEEPGTCSSSTPTPAQISCIKSIVAKYELQIGPELRCSVQKLEAQNACYEGLDCADTAAWEACYDQGGDCDDSFTESHEDEFEACEQGASGASSSAVFGAHAGRWQRATGGAKRRPGGGESKKVTPHRRDFLSRGGAAAPV